MEDFKHFTRWRSLSDFNFDPAINYAFLCDRTQNIVYLYDDALKAINNGRYDGQYGLVTKYTELKYLYAYEEGVYPEINNAVSGYSLEILKQLFGPRARCYEDFVAEDSLRYFIASNDIGRSNIKILFKTEEELVLTHIALSGVL